MEGAGQPAFIKPLYTTIATAFPEPTRGRYVICCGLFKNRRDHLYGSVYNGICSK